MRKLEQKNEWLKELMHVVIFWFAVIGGITFLAFLYESTRGTEVIPVAFFSQIVIYVSVLTSGIVICFTDIIPLKIPQKYRVVITGFGLYVAMLLYFSQTPINPFKSIALFAANTLWYVFMVAITGTIWFIYQQAVSTRYSKYLKAHQSALDHQ